MPTPAQTPEGREGPRLRIELGFPSLHLFHRIRDFGVILQWFLPFPLLILMAQLGLLRSSGAQAQPQLNELMN